MQALSFLLTYFLALGPFFCSTAPQAFFRPDRRFPTPSRAEAVKAGRRSAMAAHSVVSRPRLDSFEHGGRLDGLGPEERSVVECGPPIFRSRGLLSLPGPPFSTRSRVAGRTMASRVRRRYVPNALNKRLMHEESRGRRGPSQQGQRSAASAAKGYFDQPQATEDVVPAFHWNVAPVVHMRCRMTASLRATAIVAFLRPMRLPRASPQVFSAFGRDDRPSNTLAASNRSPRTMPSPHLEIRPANRTGRVLRHGRYDGFRRRIDLAAPHDLVGIVDDADRRFLQGHIEADILVTLGHGLAPLALRGEQPVPAVVTPRLRHVPTSKARPLWRTAQAIRASLLAS